ncbi:hypothetical protein Poli38472_001774 [Pythium oligandrum]|uniref:subtilisin n=1 Tax=Pythium oligandrum TaxID=41045 RepID=A0A8K1CVB9_PYTOL|nr:hypothetical protein Poli38472_001774 [Pythium oligandrum]|eukprot:TMW69618.1 hypothetical protein Poli38472_001774 [Pythium oligandrum]
MGRSLAASVKMIKAPAVWELGFTGEGVVVGSVDSGVRGTHEALRDNFAGEYGWYDPEAKKTNPYDVTGHGTHTVGTIVGANGIGVAPGATCMACKGCRAKGCPQSDLLACFQFMTCPTDTNGKNKDCYKTPHVVNNSWGGGQGTSTHKAVIRAWLADGILPIFSNGNNGRDGCGTVTSPGDYDIVLSVGATTAADGLAEFSSMGP